MGSGSASIITMPVIHRDEQMMPEQTTEGRRPTAAAESGDALDSVIRWTRDHEGKYLREGSLSTETSTARIFEVDENNGECAGLKLWPQEKAISLVERKIADGSYQEWRYEIRPEMAKVEMAPAEVSVTSSPISEPRLCGNSRCKKGPSGTHAIVTSTRAKYCSPSCRVAVSRREGTPRPREVVKRKRRSDAKYSSHAERQRAYERRQRSLLAGKSG